MAGLSAVSPVRAADVVLVGAGDIAACDTEADAATARLLDAIPGQVFTVGDNVYPNGTTEEFTNCYQPTWGRHKNRTRPAAGNHDYYTSGGAPYFNYFGAAAGPAGKGWYSYDLGSWHVIVLNSNCEYLGCGAGSEQEQWLRADLAAHPAECTVAYWHHPRFTTQGNHDGDRTTAFWNALYEHGVDLVVNGHSHNYERFAPMTPSAQRDDAYGIRQFISGLGGRERANFSATIAPNSQVRYKDDFGVLKLTLGSGRYDWEFLTVGGARPDSGTGTCHGRPGSSPSSSTTTTTTATPPSGDALVSDGFESGGFSAWSERVVTGDGSVAAVSSPVKSGSRAARLSAVSSASRAYLRKDFGAAQPDLTVRADVRVMGEGGANSHVSVFTFFDGVGTRRLRLYRQNQTGGQIWLEFDGGYHATSSRLPLDVWARFELRVVAGAPGSGTVEVRLDDRLIFRTATAGVPAVRSLQLGQEVAGQTFDIVVDDVTATADGTAPPPPPPAGTVLDDGFESGDFSAWTERRTAASGEVAVVSSPVRSGSRSARLAAGADGGVAYLRKALGTGPAAVTFSADLLVSQEGASRSNVPIFTLLDSSGVRRLKLYRQNQDYDKIWVSYGGGYFNTTGFLRLNTWVNVDLLLGAADPAGARSVEVRLDGRTVYRADGVAMGTLSSVQLGQDVPGQTFAEVVDNVRIATS